MDSKNIFYDNVNNEDNSSSHDRDPRVSEDWPYPGNDDYIQQEGCTWVASQDISDQVIAPVAIAIFKHRQNVH